MKTETPDLLTGLKRIAIHLGWTERQVKYHALRQGIPTFKIGGTVCARRSTLANHFAAKERAARALRKEL